MLFTGPLQSDLVPSWQEKQRQTIKIPDGRHYNTPSTVGEKWNKELLDMLKIIWECFTKRRHLHWALISTEVKRKKELREIHTRDKGAKGATKSEMCGKSQKCEQNKRTRILRNVPETCFFLKQNKTNHPRSQRSLDSAARAGCWSLPASRPQALSAGRGRRSCFYITMLFLSAAQSGVEDGFDFHLLRHLAALDTIILLMWAIGKNESTPHKVGNLLFKVLRLKKKNANPANIVTS